MEINILLIQLGIVACTCRPTNMYKIEIMYVHYIAMEIYVLAYTNIPSPFYFVCVIIMSHRFFVMDFTQS